MTPFLKLVAEAYFNNEGKQLANYTFVFPNRRSSLFFTKHLKDIVGENGMVVMLPEITTISQLISDFADMEDASTVDLILLLYNTYCEICGKHNVTPQNFDQFLFIGNIILKDFSDIDLFYADAQQVLSNTTEVKEIKSNYISPELVERLSHYFNISPNAAMASDENLWQHVNGDKRINNKFLSLWTMLYPIYTTLRDELAKQRKGYSGLIYRTAYDNIKNREKEEFHTSRFIFVGFNALSATEFLIFNKLKTAGIADFYWDYNCEMVKNSSVFMSNNVEAFPSLYDIRENADGINAHINVYAIPSNIAQLKYAAKLAQKVYNSKHNLDTAIIIPNDALYIPALSTQGLLKRSENVEHVNITFGIPLSNTSIASFIGTLARMHQRARSVKGVLLFRKEDVEAVLNSTILGNTALEPFKKIRESMDSIKTMFVPMEVFDAFNDEAQQFKVIFEPINELQDPKVVINRIRQILGTLERITSLTPNSYNNIFLESYNEAITTVEKSLENNGTPQLSINSAFRLIDLLISGLSHTFTGEPLRGLQVMGFLESRCLDFDNVIITSVNEKVLPKKSFSQSFIPNFIRKAYGIATSEFQESLYSYYFMRLISRAKNVYLLYDARKQSFGAGEYSRYVYQLKYIHPGINITFHQPKFVHQSKPNNVGNTLINIPKDERIMDIVNRFFTPEGQEQGYKFSASALKSYLECQLKFYLTYVEGLRFEDPEDSFIDSATFGTIVHNAMADIYTEGRHYTKEDVLSLKNGNTDAIIRKQINDVYFKLNDLNTPLHGTGQYIFDVVKLYVDNILEYDARRAPFKIIEMEKPHGRNGIIINGQRVNFTFTIDRLQEKDGHYEIIDYKTGSDEITTMHLEQIFEQEHKKHAIFQLLLYCEALMQEKYPEEPSIKPMIYSLRSISRDSNEDCTIKIGKSRIEYKEIREEFLAEFGARIDQIRNRDIPFAQNDNDKSCLFCGFKEICQK